MLKVLHTRLQEYMGQELPDIQDGLRKGRGGRDQKANSLWVIEKAIEVQKNVYLCFTDYTKAFVWITQTGKFLKKWEYQTILPASWKTCMQVKKQQLELDMEQRLVPNPNILQGCILLPCLFNLYAEYIVRNAGLEEA